MKVVIEREELLKGVNAVLDIVPTKTALPVLSNILMEATEGEGLRLSATDLDISILCTLSASVDVPGATTVPARKFAEIVRELPDETIILHADEGRVTLQRQGGADAMYALMSVPPEDFPELPKEIEGPEMSFPGEEEEGEASGARDNGQVLKDMIFKTAFAVSRDETRPVLNGVLWQIGDNRMTMVATDGARLVKYSKALPSSQAGSVKTEAIVPTRALNHLVKLMSSGSKLARVQFGQNHLMFDLPASDSESSEGIGAIRLFSRLVEGPYVDYEQVIPKTNGKRLKVSTELLSPAVRRVSILSSSQTHQVRISLQRNQIELSAASQEIGGEAREVLEADYADEEMAVGYNSAFLIDILRRIDAEQVLFELDSPVTAGIIRPAEQHEGEDYLCLLMPLRLND
ncbi:MAG: DNA polymerase III subunit beta [bacterium]|nr:DNA polymerase III subunit beta [bacterium]